MAEDKGGGGAPEELLPTQSIAATLVLPERDRRPWDAFAVSV